MLSLEDPQWKTDKGGRRELYDVSRPLRKLMAGEPPAPILDELTDALHHQGDVDSASYAAVAYRLEHAGLSSIWHVFALLFTIGLAGTIRNLRLRLKVTIELSRSFRLW